jgi:predicted dehydrogenase
MHTPEKKTLRIGMLGFGSMGRTHTWAIQNLPFFYGDLDFSAKVTGVCTTTLEKSERVAKQFSIPLAAQNEDELIASPDIDVIDICTPNIHHFETLKKAIASGKHVLCEKPLCISVEQARELTALAKDSKQTLGMVFNYRHLAPVMRAKQLIDRGRIGRVLSFRAAYLHNSATNVNRPVGWKHDREVCGGGVLFDLGSHAIDLMNYLCTDICEVSGLSQIGYPTRIGRNGDVWQTNADESFYLLAKTRSGACGTISVGKLQIGTNDDLSFEIYGEQGALRFSLMEPNWLYFYDGKAPDGPMGGERGFVRIECVGRYPDMTFPSPKAPAGWLYGHLHSMYTFLSSIA